jgi:hypothetical protein
MPFLKVFSNAVAYSTVLYRTRYSRSAIRTGLFNTRFPDAVIWTFSVTRPQTTDQCTLGVYGMCFIRPGTALLMHPLGEYRPKLSHKAFEL